MVEIIKPGVGVVFEVVGVIAQAADECLRHTIAAARQAVVRGVTSAYRAGCTGDDQVFKVGAQGEGNGRDDGVVALTRRLSHHIARAVHHIGVVARATAHRISARAAVECVVA